MKTHPERSVLLAYVDGELPDHEAGDVVLHVRGCEVCGAAVSEIRENALQIAGMLHLMDAGEPARWSQPADGMTEETGIPSDSDIPDEIGAPEIRARDAAGRALNRTGFAAARARAALTSGPVRVVPLRPHVRTVPALSRRSGVLRWAAGILLVTVAAASAAIVGTRVLFDAEEPTAPVTAPATAPIERGVAAVIVAPAGGAVHVALTGAGAGSRVFVTLEDRPTASVAIEGGDSPRFTAVAGRVDVDVRGATAVVRLILPRGLREAVVSMGGAVLVTVRGDAISPAAASTVGISLDDGPDPRTE